MVSNKPPRKSPLARGYTGSVCCASNSLCSCYLILPSSAPMNIGTIFNALGINSFNDAGIIVIALENIPPNHSRSGSAIRCDEKSPRDIKFSILLTMSTGSE